jgi:hypothetical protein
MVTFRDFMTNNGRSLETESLQRRIEKATFEVLKAIKPLGMLILEREDASITEADLAYLGGYSGALMAVATRLFEAARNVKQ